MRLPRQNALDTWSVWMETTHGGAHALHCCCLVLSCLVLSCLVLSCLVLSCLVLSCLVLSCLVLSCLVLRSACSHTKVSGSYVHYCPRPCSSTCRWARLATHRHWGPLHVYPELLCQLWPCNQHVCHRQRDWAVSIGSHMQQDMDISEALPHLGAPIPLFEYRSLQKTTIQKLAIIFPWDTVLF